MKLKHSQLLVIRQIDKKLKLYTLLPDVATPQNGWIKTIRKGLNMSLEQLGKRLSMSAQGMTQLEHRETDGSITLNSLKEAGNALNMKLIYGFIPVEGSLEEMIENRARQIAVNIVKRTSVTMSLEDQANSKERLKHAVDEMTQDIKREVPRSLWD